MRSGWEARGFALISEIFVTQYGKLGESHNLLSGFFLKGRGVPCSVTSQVSALCILWRSSSIKQLSELCWPPSPWCSPLREGDTTPP